MSQNKVNQTIFNFYRKQPTDKGPNPAIIIQTKLPLFLREQDPVQNEDSRI